MPMAVAFLSAASAIAFAVLSVRKAFISCADAVPHWSRAVTTATMIRPFSFFETCSIRRKSPWRVKKESAHSFPAADNATPHGTQKTPGAVPALSNADRLEEPGRVYRDNGRGPHWKSRTLIGSP